MREARPAAAVIYRDFGFTDVASIFRPAGGARRRRQVWDKAEAALKRAVEAAGLHYELNPGEGAFYGPEARIRAARRHRPRLAMRHASGRSYCRCGWTPNISGRTARRPCR